MSYLTSIIPLFTLFLLRKYFSRYYFTPTGFLSMTWVIFILLKLFYASDFLFSVNAAFLIDIFIASFFLGEFVMYIYISKFNNSFFARNISNTNGFKQFNILTNQRKIEFFEKIILIFGLLSLVGSLLYINFFIVHFGSLVNLLTAGWAVRGALEDIKIPLFIRAILLLGYSSVILTLLYNIIYKKFKFYFLFSYISILLMGITQAGRAGLMMLIFQIFIATYWREIYNNIIKKITPNNFFRTPEYILAISSLKLVIFISVIFIGGDMLRSQNFTFNDDILLQGISSFKSYLFGGIAGFTSYIKDYKFNEFGFGRFTFSSLFELLGIHKNTPGIYTDYLRISNIDLSLETNIFTAFRQLIDDFGIIGSILFMFFFGSMSYYFFRKAIRGDVASIAFLIVFYSFIFHTPLLAITVHTSVLISAILPYLIIKLLLKRFNLK